MRDTIVNTIGLVRRSSGEDVRINRRHKARMVSELARGHGVPVIVIQSLRTGVIIKGRFGGIGVTVAMQQDWAASNRFANVYWVQLA